MASYTTAFITCLLLQHSWGFNQPSPLAHQRSQLNAETAETRRNFFASVASTTLATTFAGLSQPANAASKSTADATITDKIFIEFKGIPGEEGAASYTNDRIVIGLFGNDAKQPVSILKQIVTKDGYKSKCKPLDDSRTFEKEQLEANKVYNSCIENEDKVGVNYEYSTVWRVMKDERIDVGAVSGKFVARENPIFEDNADSGLKHDAAGVVSVLRGDAGGYGFTIYPGGIPTALDEDNVVVGRILEGLDVVEKLNKIPVVRNTFGGNKTKNAPSRGCRYGGSEYYCSENKPLKKVMLDKTGLL